MNYILSILNIGDSTAAVVINFLETFYKLSKKKSCSWADI